MKKYLTALLLSTILLIPFNVFATESPLPTVMEYPADIYDNGNNPTTRSQIDDGDIDDLDDLFDNDNRNNRNDNGINPINENIDPISDEVEDDDDNDELITYIIIGLTGLVIGAFGSYLFIKKD